MTDDQEQLNLPSKEALLKAYIPFVQNGGFYLPNCQNHMMGDTFKVELNLIDDNE